MVAELWAYMQMSNKQGFFATLFFIVVTFIAFIIMIFHQGLENLEHIMLQILIVLIVEIVLIIVAIYLYKEWRSVDKGDTFERD